MRMVRANVCGLVALGGLIALMCAGCSGSGQVEPRRYTPDKPRRATSDKPARPATPPPPARHPAHEHPHGPHPHALSDHHHHPHPHPHLAGLDDHHHPY
jgi:hypothetical protein